MPSRDRHLSVPKICIGCVILPFNFKSSQRVSERERERERERGGGGEVRDRKLFDMSLCSLCDEKRRIYNACFTVERPSLQLT